MVWFCTNAPIHIKLIRLSLIIMCTSCSFVVFPIIEYVLKYRWKFPNLRTYTLCLYFMSCTRHCAGEVKPNCEYQQTCSSRGQQVNRAEVTCYDSSCSVQNGLPVRMCRDCHAKKHKDVTDSRHFFQGTSCYTVKCWYFRYEKLSSSQHTCTFVRTLYHRLYTSTCICMYMYTKILHSGSQFGQVGQAA